MVIVVSVQSNSFLLRHAWLVNHIKSISMWVVKQEIIVHRLVNIISGRRERTTLCSGGSNIDIFT